VLDVEIDILGAKLYENWLLESSKVVDKDGIAA
jgi:hypothetical protein